MKMFQRQPRGLPIRLFILACLAVFALAPVCACATDDASSAEPDALRVLSYNVHHGYGTDGAFDLQRIAEVIRMSKADLVALQEVDQRTSGKPFPDYIQELARLTKMHGVFGRAEDYGGGVYGNGVLSRYPIVANDVYPFDFTPGMSPRSVTFAKIRLPGGGMLGFFQLISTIAARRIDADKLAS